MMVKVIYSVTICTSGFLPRVGTVGLPQVRVTAPTQDASLHFVSAKFDTTADWCSDPH